ncbi:glucose 1-dehydrogenase [Cohnella lubricantis]|uniref:SDR family oxidoreductase n=1 Tax=Cohnella lubricantis TaxID=2163172 RepID=A0A841T489_9BACL|nr:glucose 1-dehydrogenase [Cohnella lubricantis]MBB6676164.1 SDR family oxidoreductase [Cohnella lubricantis]MBP2118644.1 NAD(P)-dependent dehydrogenase (short-subunit alcohol dehydrogenase family) [Cohnella lubricantis]
MFGDLTVVITGAAGGIGRALSRAYAENGASVLLTDLPGETGEALARSLEQEGGRTRFFGADLSEPESAARIMAAAVDTFGGVDILINNAGLGIWKPPLELSLDEWDSVLNVNLRGTFLCSREAAKVMKRQGRGGSIVNLSSTRHLQSEPNSEAYAASKGGIASLTHALALSLGADRIRVNAISPGWIETGDYTALKPEDHSQHPAGRVGMPEDIVRACFYLTDPKNNFVTGINLTVDGGMTRKMIYVE